jgi:signal transduction histidine kinase
MLLGLLSIWAVVFYYAMFNEIHDSIDDGLENRKMLLIARANEDISLLDKPQYDEYLFTVKQVNYNDYRGFKDVYKDSVMYMVNEKDYEPVRLLESVFKKNEDYYKISIVTSMVEEDDQINNLLKYTLILYAVLVLSILLLNNLFLRKVWRPFYRILDQLKVYQLEKNEPIEFNATNIEEFSLLNKSIEKLLIKTQQSYANQKQFIENASHELQTPLAIAINKLELLFEDETLSETQAEQLQQTLENLERLTRLNRSLLLISKIENDQFQTREEVDVQAVIDKIISDFSEMLTHKNQQVNFDADHKTVKNANSDLIYILFSNLIRNTISHGRSSSEISMKLTDNNFVISNYSHVDSLQNESIFQRFKKIGNNANSTGLGLSIAKSIAEKFGFTLEYHFQNGQHYFTVEFN